MNVKQLWHLIAPPFTPDKVDSNLALMLFDGDLHSIGLGEDL